MLNFPSTRYKLHPAQEAEGKHPNVLPKRIYVTIIGDPATHDALAADDWTSDLSALVETHPSQGETPEVDYVPIQVQDVLAGLAAANEPKPKGKKGKSNGDAPASTESSGSDADKQVIADEQAAEGRA